MAAAASVGVSEISEFDIQYHQLSFEARVLADTFTEQRAFHKVALIGAVSSRILLSSLETSLEARLEDFKKTHPVLTSSGLFASSITYPLAFKGDEKLMAFWKHLTEFVERNKTKIITIEDTKKI